MKTQVWKALALVCLAAACFGQTTVILAPIPVFQSFLQNGSVNSFGCVFTYASQTTTPISSWTDFSGTTLNANPVVLSAGGTASIWIQAGISYSLVIKSSGGTNCSSGSTVATVAGIGGGSSTQTTNVAWSSTPTFTVTAQNQLFTITLAGNTAALPVSVVGIVPPATVTFQITQDGTGSRTFTWPANVLGGSGIGGGAGETTTQQFIWNGTNLIATGPGIETPEPAVNSPRIWVGDLIATGAIQGTGIMTNLGNQVVSNIKNTTAVTFTGDTALHTAYTIPIAGGTMSATGQMRITLLVIVNSATGNPNVTIKYGGTTIGGGSTVPPGNVQGFSLVIDGGNIGGLTNSQTWNDAGPPLFLQGSIVGGGEHSSAIDSTVSQNLTVTYQGGVNGDSITFSRIFVEFL